MKGIQSFTFSVIDVLCFCDLVTTDKVMYCIMDKILICIMYNSDVQYR